MIKFFRKIRQNLVMENSSFCHSVLDAESKYNYKWIPTFAGITEDFNYDKSSHKNNRQNF